VCSRERITPPNKTLAVQASIETNKEPKKNHKNKPTKGKIKNNKAPTKNHPNPPPFWADNQ
jgi:hypothetical protein